MTVLVFTDVVPPVGEEDPRLRTGVVGLGLGEELR